MSKIRPIGDKVVVRLIEAEAKTASGIFLTSIKEMPLMGEVVAVGKKYNPKGTAIPFTVKIGDKVVIGKFGYDEIVIDGERLLAMPEAVIIGILE